MTDTLEDFERSEFTADGATRTVYRLGSGRRSSSSARSPGSPQRRPVRRMVAAIGCTAVMPSVFGEDGRDPTMPYVLRSISKACVSREFAILALDRPARSPRGCAPSPVRDERCGGPGVGAVGMCLTVGSPWP